MAGKQIVQNTLRRVILTEAVPFKAMLFIVTNENGTWLNGKKNSVFKGFVMRGFSQNIPRIYVFKKCYDIMWIPLFSQFFAEGTQAKRSNLFIIAKRFCCAPIHVCSMGHHNSSANVLVKANGFKLNWNTCIYNESGGTNANDEPKGCPPRPPFINWNKKKRRFGLVLWGWWQGLLFCVVWSCFFVFLHCQRMKLKMQVWKQGEPERPNVSGCVIF